MRSVCLATAMLVGCSGSLAASDGKSHPPQRPLPTASHKPLGDGVVRFVDPTKGQDDGPGSETQPWRSLRFALRQVEPGDTLCLRGGVYYEKAALSRSGEPERPITIRNYPGELPVIDGGLREFYEKPAESWEPYADGAEEEYVSTRTYPNADARRAPYQFLPAAWEPMWGIEDERPLALGHFADSMVPLHSYRLHVDLQADNEQGIGNRTEMREQGIYCGPGLWFNRRTGRIHIRLRHHQLEGLGDRAYRGETDPRQLRLVVAAGFGEEVLRITGVKHVKLQGLVLRGATGSPLMHIYGSQDVHLDHVTAYGGFPALLINASQRIRVTHSAIRGLAAPWTSRAHMKYRGTASYQIVLRDDQPRNEDIEFANCEFTDDHDFAYFRFANNLRFHHNLVDNFNDDGLECGAKLRDHSIHIFQNRIGRCLIPLAQHQIEKDESPAEHDEGSGVHVYRNIFDMRGGTYSSPPREPDPSGAYLHREGHLISDHGSPIWPVMRVYHNTLLRDTPVFRNYFLFGLGAAGLRKNERDVFNNIFVQTERVPGVVILGKQASPLREGGNLLWGYQEGPSSKEEAHFQRLRRSPLFAASKAVYPAGWTTHDAVADPRFQVAPSANNDGDLRLAPGSPAVDFGQPLPADWPDPLRRQDAEAPDAGALPLGVEPWSIGIDGRINLFSGR